MGKKGSKAPVWHDGRLTGISIGETRDVTLSVDLNGHWNGGSFLVGTAYVKRIENFDEARAFLQGLSPSVAAPLGVLDICEEDGSVVLALLRGTEPLTFRFRGAQLTHL